MKNPHLIAAAVKAAAKGSTFVLASTDQSLARDANALQAAVEATALHEYVCSSCGTELRTTASAEPFCITCGSASVTAKSEKVVASGMKDDSSVVAVTCNSCSHTAFVDEASARAITASSNGHLHCVACGSAMRVNASDFLYDAEDTSDSEDTDTLDDVRAFQTEDGDDFDADGEIEMEGSDLDGDDDLSMTDDADFSIAEMEQDLTASDDLLIPDSPSTPGGPVDSMEFIPDALEPIVDDSPDLSVLDEAVDEASSLDLPDVGEPLVDTFGLDDAHSDVSFIESKHGIVAMKGPISVGLLTAKSAGSRADIMRTPAFIQACQKVVVKSGLRSGLNKLGFSLIRSSTISQATVTQKVTAAQMSADSKVAAYKKTMIECMAIAAAGLNRGQWKGQMNPLRAAVERELNRVGVRNPRSVAASVFNSAGIEHAKTLVSVASSLAAMSPFQRQEIVAALDFVEPQPEPDVSVDAAGDEDFDLDVAARMTTAGARGFNVQATAAATDAASSVLNGTAPLTFSSF